MEVKTSVVNIKHTPHWDVLIDRTSIYGNPFRIGVDGDRIEVLEKYKIYFYNRILTDVNFKRKVETLKGKVLGCHCFPDLCHGMIIIEYLDGTPCIIERPKPTDNKFFES